MKSPLRPNNEAQRQTDLDQYQILDTGAEQGFDDITKLASLISGKPIALVSLVDKDRQWFKSKVGLTATETPRDVSFCGHAILGDELMLVPDAQADPRFIDNPLVTGEPNVIFYAGVPLTSPNGHNLGTLCVIDHEVGDLTETQKTMLTMLARQVVAQMELRKTTARIAAHAKRLQEVNADLTAANAAKADFIANFSHEIRTPLNAVIGSLHLLADKPLADDAMRFVTMGVSAADTLLQLINDVLDMAKIEAGKLELHYDPVDLTAVSQDVVHLFRGQASNAKIQLDFTASASCAGYFLTDNLRIKQILINLMGNAIKFTPSGGFVRLQFDIATDDGKTLAKWDIQDTGVGMSPETLAIIGERFTQADASVPTKFGGSGIGLHLVKTLIAMLGGSLNIKSTPGIGTVVSIAIPARPAVANLPKTANEKTTMMESCTVLIVDDTATNRIVLRKMLESLGFTCAEATGGRDAIRVLGEHYFPLILLDIQMPEVDGFEVLRSIRAMELQNLNRAKTRVVAVTGNTFTDDVKKCLDAGFDAHVAKPITKQALAQMLSSNIKTPKVDQT